MRFFVLLAVIGCAAAVNFKIKNKAGGAIWVGIQGNNGKQALEGGGFKLNQNEEKTVSAPDDWAGRFWARTWCNGNTNHCETGDCGNKLQCGGNGGAPPASLAEITLRGHEGQDFYDISLVDGFNLPASIAPQGGQGSCKTVSCNKDLNPGCPGQLQLKGSSGAIIGCYSSCAKFNTDQYCCSGANNKPETCHTDQWPVNSAKYFKDNCPDAYSYAYDDKTSTFTCVASTYLVTFG